MTENRSFFLRVAEDDVVWIKTCREKTGIDYEIPLFDLPLQILERYRGTASGGRLLPMYCNSSLNRELKHIVRICGIEKRFTFHAGRHRILNNNLICN